jgi:methylthioribulose-1-phosphate dehydratase
MATLMLEKRGVSEFRITHQEMIKGIRVGGGPGYHKFYDTCVIPVIDNTPDERDLRDSLERAMNEYPHTNAVLVNRHGIYVWGSTWQQAKAMCECYDYLLGVGVEMMKLGMEPDDVPASSTYKDVATVYGKQ